MIKAEILSQRSSQSLLKELAIFPKEKTKNPDHREKKQDNNDKQ